MNRLLAVSMELAKRGGDRLWSIRKGHSSNTDSLNSVVKGKTKEGADELLTQGDLQSHHIIHSGIKIEFPDIKLVSEEHDDNSGDSVILNTLPAVHLYKEAENVLASDLTVWIDPLDATKEYTENLLHYVTTMVCVAVRGVPTIGVIYQPFNNELVWGFVDHGLSPNLAHWIENGQKMKKNSSTRIVVSRSHAGTVENTVKASLDGVVVIPAGGAGYKVLQLLNSSVDAYVHTTRIKKWDICAGNAILNAVDGHMTTLSGQTIDYSDTDKPQNDAGLLATLHRHKHFLKVFNKHR